MEIMHHREEIGTLKDQAGARKEISEASKKNETAFKKVEAALIAKEIKTGDLSTRIQKRCGPPSAAAPEGDGQRWLYRSLQGGLLDKPWIWLYFDKTGALVRWECGHTAACAD